MFLNHILIGWKYFTFLNFILKSSPGIQNTELSMNFMIFPRKNPCKNDWNWYI